MTRKAFRSMGGKSPEPGPFKKKPPGPPKYTGRVPQKGAASTAMAKAVNKYQEKTGKKITPKKIKQIAKKPKGKLGLLAILGTAIAAGIGIHMAKRPRKVTVVGEEKKKKDPKWGSPMDEAEFPSTIKPGKKEPGKPGKPGKPGRKKPKGPGKKKPVRPPKGRRRPKGVVRPGVVKPGVVGKPGKAGTAERGRDGKVKRRKKDYVLATLATGLAASIPAIHRTAKGITKWMGPNLQKLGLVGLSAGAIYGIAKLIAKKRAKKGEETQGPAKATPSRMSTATKMVDSSKSPKSAKPMGNRKRPNTKVKKTLRPAPKKSKQMSSNNKAGRTQSWTYKDTLKSDKKRIRR